MKERKNTSCVPGSEKYVRTRNNRLMLKCKCENCGITKTKFVRKSGKGLLLGKNSPFKNIPIIGDVC